MSENPLVNEFTERYLSEYDNVYSQANLPINPEVLQDVEYLLLGAGGAVGAGFLQKLGSDTYDKIKSALVKKVAEESKSSDKVILLEGERIDQVFLNFGNTRPAFIIPKGSKLVLRDVTVAFEGEPARLIQEELAPSFFTDNVLFLQIKSAKGPYQIHEPIYVGNKSKKS
jgi:hypothetical protein